MASVYVIGPACDKPVKIGYAKCPEQRLGDLQVGTHEELFIYYSTSHLTLDEAKKIERAVHKAFATKHIRGEWFDVSIEEATKEIDRHIDTRVYAARVLASFDLRQYLEPAQIETIKVKANGNALQ